VQVGGGHADGGVGGDCPVVVGEGDGVHALEAVEGAVGEAEAFVYNGGEVGEGFEIVGWRRVGGGWAGSGTAVRSSWRRVERMEGLARMW